MNILTMLCCVTDANGNTGKYQVDECVFKHFKYIKGIMEAAKIKNTDTTDIILPPQFTLEDMQILADIAVSRILGGRFSTEDFTIHIHNIRIVYLLEFLGVNFDIQFEGNHKAYWMKRNNSFGLYTVPQKTPDPIPRVITPILEIKGPYYISKKEGPYDDPTSLYNTNYCYYKIVPIFSFHEYMSASLSNKLNVDLYLQKSTLEGFLAYAFRENKFSFNFMINQNDTEDEYNNWCRIAYELYDRYIRKMEYYSPGELEKMEPNWVYKAPYMPNIIKN